MYPLYLLDRGNSVVLIGNASLALNVGCIAGTIPALLLLRSPGLKGATVLSLAGVSLGNAARLWHTQPLMVYGGAFAAGFFLAVLTVGIAVTISRLTVPANRAVGFSWFFMVTITSGFVGDVIGGELPEWIGDVSGEEQPGDQKLAALLLACMIGSASAIPAAGLRFSEGEKRAQLRFPRGQAAVRLLIAIAFWNFAVGLFAPFYAIYFSAHLHQSVRTIGLDLASGQVVGAAFTMLVPALIAGWGAIPGVRFIMFAAGACSFLLSMATSTLAAGIGYAAYMGFVAMAQPALNTLLMNQVREDEQAGASMMNSLFVFSAVAAGGFVGARLIAVLGYQPMLEFSGACCMLAAVVFVVMVKPHHIAGEKRIAA